MENVSCAPKVSVSCFRVCADRELQLPVRVAGKKVRKRGLEQSHVLRWTGGVERRGAALLTLWPLEVSVSRRGVDGRQHRNAAFSF
jgi:hypothetical protein